MQKSHKISRKAIGAVLAGLLLTNTGWAASISWSIGGNHNNHYYERFDKPQVSWEAARYQCNALRGYLVTINSREEQGFIAANFLVFSKGFKGGYHIGGFTSGTDNTWERKWQWDVTKEPWGYNNLYKDPQGMGQYLAIYGNGWWLYKDIPAHIDGYICEWNSKKTKMLSSVVVPDINQSGTPELATLYQNTVYQDATTNTYTHSVKINDWATNTLIKELTFSGWKTPSVGMVVLKNIETTNKTPEIGVLLYNAAKKQVIVQVKDVKDNTKVIKTLPFFLEGKYVPTAISVLPDSNANGSEEVAVFGINPTTKRSRMEVYDYKISKLIAVSEF